MHLLFKQSPCVCNAGRAVESGHRMRNNSFRFEGGQIGPARNRPVLLPVRQPTPFVSIVGANVNRRRMNVTIVRTAGRTWRRLTGCGHLRLRLGWRLPFRGQTLDQGIGGI